jgi:hypothetical protein
MWWLSCGMWWLSRGMWWLSWLRQLDDTRLPTQWSRVRIRQPSQSPERDQEIMTVYQKQVSGWEASLPEQKKKNVCLAI